MVGGRRRVVSAAAGLWSAAGAGLAGAGLSSAAGAGLAGAGLSSGDGAGLAGAGLASGDGAGFAVVGGCAPSSPPGVPGSPPSSSLLPPSSSGTRPGLVVPLSSLPGPCGLSGLSPLPLGSAGIAGNEFASPGSVPAASSVGVRAAVAVGVGVAVGREPIGAELLLQDVGNAVLVRVHIRGELHGARVVRVGPRLHLEVVAHAIAVRVLGGVRARRKVVRREALVRNAVGIRVGVEIGARRIRDAAVAADAHAGAARRATGVAAATAVAAAAVAAAARAGAGEAGATAAAGRAAHRQGHEIAGRADAEAEPAEAARRGGAGRRIGVADAERPGAGELDGLALVLLARGGEAVPVGHGREQGAADQDRRDQASGDGAREPEVAGVRSAPLRVGAATTDAVIRHSSSSPIQPAHRRNPRRAEELWTRSGRLFDADRRVSEDLDQTLNR